MTSIKPTVDNHVNQAKVIDAASSKRIEYLYSLLNELRYYLFSIEKLYLIIFFFFLLKLLVWKCYIHRYRSTGTVPSTSAKNPS